ncbi:NAD(P)-binding domain-containing protein [Streptomyces sp. L7]
MPETLGLIGSGNIGAAVARLAVAAGLDVVLSNSRGPGTLADLVAELGPGRPGPPPRTRPRGPVTWWWPRSRCGHHEQLPARRWPAGRSSTQPSTTPTATAGWRSWRSGQTDLQPAGAAASGGFRVW